MSKGEVMKPFRAPRKCVDNPTLEVESQEATEFGLVRSCWVVPETEVEASLTSQENRHRTDPPLQSHTSVSVSPNVTEFERYLEGLPSQGPSTLPLSKPAHMSKDQWWESVLQAEKVRLQQLQEAHPVPVDDILVPVDAMLLDAESSDDDIPIVQTLLQAATAQAKKKKNVKTLWSYETVTEPTGVQSKYWDSPAPRERATKQQAKHKLDELKKADKQPEGASYINNFALTCLPLSP